MTALTPNIANNNMCACMCSAVSTLIESLSGALCSVRLTARTVACCSSNKNIQYCSLTHVRRVIALDVSSVPLWLVLWVVGRSYDSSAGSSLQVLIRSSFGNRNSCWSLNSIVCLVWQQAYNCICRNFFRFDQITFGAHSGLIMSFFQGNFI